MEIKQAYEILGLEEGASYEEVNKRFDLLIRQARSRNRDIHAGPHDAEQSDERISKAYRLITDTENARIIEQKRQENYNKWGKLAGPKERWDDFLRLHRTKLILGIIAIIIIIAGISTYHNHQQEQARLAKLPPIDLSVMFIGDFAASQDSNVSEQLESSLLADFPQWKRISTRITLLPNTTDQVDQTTLALQQKAQIDVMTEKPEIYVLDQHAFDWLVQGGGLANLDQLTDQTGNKLNLPANIEASTHTNDDPTSHVYGLHISSSPLISKLPIASSDLIIGVRAGTPLTGKTLQFLSTYMNSIPGS